MTVIAAFVSAAGSGLRVIVVTVLVLGALVLLRALLPKGDPSGLP